MIAANVAMAIPRNISDSAAAAIGSRIKLDEPDASFNQSSSRDALLRDQFSFLLINAVRLLSFLGLL